MTEAYAEYEADDEHCPYITEWPWPNRSFLSAMFMPQGARRLELTLTDVRVQRLLDITEEDAKQEGVEPWHLRFPEMGPEQTITTGERARDQPYRSSFAVTWDEINGDRALWKSNPWVWALSFTVRNRLEAE